MLNRDQEPLKDVESIVQSLSKKDLVVNVYNNGVCGSFRHLPLSPGLYSCPSIVPTYISVFLHMSSMIIIRHPCPRLFKINSGHCIHKNIHISLKIHFNICIQDVCRVNHLTILYSSNLTILYSSNLARDRACFCECVDQRRSI